MFFGCLPCCGGACGELFDSISVALDFSFSISGYQIISASTGGVYQEIPPYSQSASVNVAFTKNPSVRVHRFAYPAGFQPVSATVLKPARLEFTVALVTEDLYQTPSYRFDTRRYGLSTSAQVTTGTYDGFYLSVTSGANLVFRHFPCGVDGTDPHSDFIFFGGSFGNGQDQELYYTAQAEFDGHSIVTEDVSGQTNIFGTYAPLPKMSQADPASSLAMSVDRTTTYGDFPTKPTDISVSYAVSVSEMTGITTNGTTKPVSPSWLTNLYHT